MTSRAKIKNKKDIEMSKPTKKQADPQEFKPIRARTENQQNVIDTINCNDIIFISGPAGCGKSLLSVAVGAQLYKMGKIQRIILTRPIVEVGRSIGFLPGDVKEKIGPYYVPLFDSFKKMFSYQDIATMQNEGIIEICPLSMMRGRNFDDSYLICDEGSNCSRTEIILLMTRLGQDSKLVINGDPNQSDLPPQDRGAFEYFSDLLKGVEGVSSVKMANGDIQRHQVVGRVLSRIEKAEKMVSYGDRIE